MGNSNNKSSVHVLPLKVYLGIGGALLLLTAVTVAIAQIDFGAWNLAVVLGIAGIKASLVLLYFMHLKYDNKLYGLIFLISITMLIVFIVLTLFDTLRRGDLNPERKIIIDKYAVIYDDFGKPLSKQAREKNASQSAMLSSFELKHGIGPIKEEVILGPIDMEKVKFARPIFESKCASCHKMDKRSAGPPLRDVTERRTPAYILNQILNPEENVKRHPEGQKLLAEYYIYMTFQNVTEDDARALLEYLRWEATQKPAVEK